MKCSSVARTRNYTLDPLERLTSVKDAANTHIETYTLDAEGYRTTSHKSSVHVTDPANRLREDQTHQFEYDVNGNQIRKTTKATGETWRYSYSIFDELARAGRHASADLAAPELEWKTYKYDGFGRLTDEQRSTGIVNFMLYDGEHVVLEGDDSTFFLNNFRQWYTYSDTTDDLLAITPQATAPVTFQLAVPSQTQHYSVHTDHQGSVRAITDLGGLVVNAYAYDAYGNAEEAVEGLAPL